MLDPIFALRRRVRMPPGGTVRVAFWTLVASSREALLDLVDKHHDASAFERAATLAWTQAQVQLRHLGIGPTEANLFQRLAGHVLYADPSLRPSSDVIRRGLAPPPALWAHGISGDLPIVLVRIDDVEDVDIVRQLLRAHEYWRMKHLAVDLVILNERGASYVQDLQIALETLVRIRPSPAQLGAERQPGSVFVLRADLIVAEHAHACCYAAGARRAARPPRQPGRAARPAADATRRAAGAVAPADPPAPRPQPTCRRRRRRICSSSTASAASRPTAANM